MPYLVGYITPQDYGAVGNGVTDDSAAINSALAAAPAGGVVLLTPGTTYAIGSPIKIPPQVELRGSHGAHLDQLTNPSVKLLSTFSGAAAILVLDQTTGGYSVASNEQRIRYLTVDCSAATGSVDGIQAQGLVHGVYLEEVQLRYPPAHGIAFVTNSSGTAYSWRGTRVRVLNAGTIGFSVSITDSTWFDCESLNAGSHGWFLVGAANCHLVSCRGEWSALDGFNISGSMGTGTGSGGFTMVDCSTDRNGHNGVNFTSVTGNPPIEVTGLMCRRDGRNGGSGGGNYAALAISGCTAPINVNGITVYPGVDDSGSGTNSPQYGVSITSTSTKVAIDSVFAHAATTAWNDDGTNTVTLGPTIELYTGSTSSPTAATLPTVIYRMPTSYTAASGTSIGVTGGSTGQRLIGATGADTTSIALAAGVTGQSFDTLRVTCDGTVALGPGTATRDTTVGRAGAGILYTPKNLLVGAASPLGDNGVGEVQIANAATVPSTNPAGGVTMYATGGILTYRNPQGLVQTIVGSQGGLTATTSISNTAAETLLQGMTLPANDATAGAVYMLHGYGVLSWTGTPTITWTARLGGTAGTLLAQVPAYTLGSAQTNAPFKYEIILNFLSATTAQCSIDLEMVSSASGDTVSTPFLATPSSATSVSIATSKVFQIDVTWGTASASNSIALLGGYTERVA